MPRLVALVGPPGCGKTSVCARLAERARAQGMRVAGILSPGAPDDPSGRCARVVVDLATGASRPLGRRATLTGGARPWDLDETALAWGAAAARRGASGADVLIIDELGRIELDEGRGWVECVELLREARGLAVVSVREACVPALRVRLGVDAERLEVVRVDAANRSTLPDLLVGDAR